MDPISAAIEAGGGLAKTGVNTFFQWWGMRKQIEENRRAESLGLKIRKEDLYLAEKWKSKEYQLAMKNFGLREDEMSLMNEKFEWNKDMAELSREDALERQNYDRVQGFAGNMVSQINQNRGFKNNLINVMGQRRAA